MNLGGGSYITEVGWEILDEAGNLIASGSGEDVPDLPLSFDDGEYTVNGTDSWGDGWNGNYLSVTNASNGFQYINFTITSGYDGTATFNIGTVLGCTDGAACNYNSVATDDDGTCCFGDDCNDIVVDGGSWQSEVSWDIIDASGVEVAEGSAPYNHLLCLDDGTYTVNGYDSFGDGWNGNYLTIYDSEGHLALNFTLDAVNDDGYSGSTTFTLPTTPPDADDLVLTAVLDLDLPEAGSTGKALQFQAMDDITDLSWYGVGVAQNGRTDGQEYQFPIISVEAKETVWLVRYIDAYANYFGADFGSNDIVLEAPSEISQNGDDAIELFLDGTLVDLLGNKLRMEREQLGSIGTQVGFLGL